MNTILVTKSTFGKKHQKNIKQLCKLKKNSRTINEHLLMIPKNILMSHFLKTIGIVPLFNMFLHSNCALL